RAAWATEPAGTGQPDATGRTSRRTSRRLRATGGGGGRSREGPRTHTPRAFFVVPIGRCGQQFARPARQADGQPVAGSGSGRSAVATWHATVWSGASTRGTGVTVEHSATASGHRNRNRHPGVGSTT